MLSIDEGYEALRTGSPVAVAVPRDILEVVGPEAASFLQGQLSQDVAALSTGASVPAFLLDPTGKLGFWLRVTRVGDERFLLDLDADFGAEAQARLERFKLRTKARVAMLDWCCTAHSRSAGSAPADARTGTDAGDLGDPVDPAHAGVRATAAWPAAFGLDRLAPADASGDPDLPVAPLAALDAVRIEAGIPALGAELLPGVTIPAEAGPQVIESSVSFTKGCYTGQELVARIDARGGNVPRRLEGVVIDATRDDLPAVGDEVLVGGEAVSVLTSVAWSPRFGAAVALTMLPRAVGVPVADAVVRTSTGDRPARLAPLPLER